MGRSIILVIGVLLLAGPALGAGAPNIVIWDPDTTGHGAMCQAAAMAESGLTIDHVPISAVIPYSYPAADYPIISHSYFCSSYLDLDREFSKTRIVSGHACTGTVSDYSFASGPFSVAAVASGGNIEMTTPAGSDSEAVARLAGQAAYVWNENPTWDMWQVRAALRQTAANYPNWVAGTGFGDTNKVAAAAVTSFDLHGPVNVKVTLSSFDNLIKLEWVNFATPDWGKTYAVKFSSEPAEDSTPVSAGATILYSGTATTVSFPITESGSFWLAFYSENTAADAYSKLYPIYKKQVSFTYQRAATNVFFDNTVNNSVQDGLSWPTAYTTFNSLKLINEDSLYFRESLEPYFIDNGSYSVNWNWYGGATGNGTELGSGKSILTTAISIVSTAWAIHSGDTYRVESGVAAMDKNHLRDVFTIDSGGSVSYLTRGDSRDTLTAGQWYYGDSTTTPTESPVATYANWGSSGPPAKVWVLTTVANPAFKSPLKFTPPTPYPSRPKLVVKGIKSYFNQDGLRTSWNQVSTAVPQFYFEIEDNELAYNQNGFYFDYWKTHAATLTDFLYRRNYFHDNEDENILASGQAMTSTGQGAGQGVRLFFDHNIIFNGGLSGVKFKASLFDAGAAYAVYFRNNTIANNGAKGLWLDQNATTNSVMPFYAYNNISVGNTDEEFFIYDDAGLVLTASNNCNGGGTYGGKWAAAKGAGNVEADPLLQSDYRIPLWSPAYKKGLFIAGFHDAAGATDGFGTVLQPVAGQYIFREPAIGASQPQIFEQEIPGFPIEDLMTWGR